MRREGLTCVGGGVVAFDTDTNEDFGAVALNPTCTYESFEELFKKNSAFLFWVQPGNQHLFTIKVENHGVRAELGELDGVDVERLRRGKFLVWQLDFLNK